MRNGLYINTLEHGAPLFVKVASLAASTVLYLIIALPVLALGAAVVA